MAVAFDAVGPSSSGSSTFNVAAASWSHTVSGTNTVLLVGVGVGDDSNPAVSSVKYNGVAMTSLGSVLPNNQSAVGYLQVFALTNPSSGTYTVTVTLAAAADFITGGSLSFNGATAVSAATIAHGTGTTGTTTASVTVSSTTNGNIVAGFTGNGSGTVNATSPATSRYIAVGDDNTADGNSAGATSPSTGSAVTVAWSINSDWWGAIAVEVQAMPKSGLFPGIAF